MEGWGGYENLPKFLNKRAYEKLQKLIGELKVSSCDINMATYLCHHCGMLNERLNYEICFHPIGAYHSSHRCSKCRRSLIKRTDLSKISNGSVNDGGLKLTLLCPQCGDPLHETCRINWD